MTMRIILASGSQIRATLLKRAGVAFDVIPADVDEAALKAELIAEGSTPESVALSLANAKAQEVSEAHPGTLVLGADQVLCHRGTLFSKPETPAHACEQIKTLSDDIHALISAASLCRDGTIVARWTDQARVTMRALNEDEIDRYVRRNWDSIRHSVGGYKIEEEGLRLFSSIEGDYFTILGLPLLPILSYLTDQDILSL